MAKVGVIGERRSYAGCTRTNAQFPVAEGLAPPRAMSIINTVGAILESPLRGRLHEETTPARASAAAIHHERVQRRRLHRRPVDLQAQARFFGRIYATAGTFG